MPKLQKFTIPAVADRLGAHPITVSACFPKDISPAKKLALAVLELPAGQTVQSLDLRNADFSRLTLQKLPIFIDCLFQYSSFDYSNIVGCKFQGCDFRSANMLGAFLSANMLPNCDFTDVDWSAVTLCGNTFNGATLDWADLADCWGALAVEGLDQALLKAVGARGRRLYMEAWHSGNVDYNINVADAHDRAAGWEACSTYECETTHCRAGWTCILAGYVGGWLESQIGSGAAASLIYTKTYPGRALPDFYASHTEAMTDIKRCARLSANKALRRKA